RWGFFLPAIPGSRRDYVDSLPQEILSPQDVWLKRAWSQIFLKLNAGVCFLFHRQRMIKPSGLNQAN
ncbi:MAG: hypothetical protein RSD94_11335, partial [Acinetobacter sp.]